MGNFCPHCGQKATVGRITLKKSIREAIDNFFNLNRGLLPTFRDLLLRPGAMLSGYVEGKRRRYVHPVRFMLAVIAFSYLIYFVLIPDGWMVEPPQMAVNSGDQITEEFGQWVLDTVAKNYTLLTLSIVPFLAFWFSVFFKKNGFNMGEHFTVLTYVSAMTTLLPVVFLTGIFAGVLSATQFLTASYIIYLGYTMVAMILWMKPRQRVLAVVKSLFAYLFGFAGWAVVFGVFITLVAFNRGILDPEDFKPAEETSISTDSLSTEPKAPIFSDSLEAQGH